MPKTKVEDIRNVAIVGHGAAGKTSLIDRLLVKTGAVEGQPNVDSGTSIGDFDPEEKQHKYTIESKVMHFNYGGKRFNVLDTPGYPDFIGQTICALQGVDLALVAINAHTGIGVNTRRVFKEAEKMGLGRAIVITKMDTDNIDFPGLIDSIQELWGSGCVLMNVPIGCGPSFKGVVQTLNLPKDTTGALIDPLAVHDNLIETIVQTDAAVMERYFEGTLPTDEEFDHLFEHAIAEGLLIPILCCSAKMDLGISELLEFLVHDAPSPLDVHRKGTKDGKEMDIIPDPNGPLIANVFRTRIDPFVQKLSFIRVLSGTMKKDDLVLTSTNRKGLKLGPLLEVQGAESHAVEFASAGEVVAIAKTEELHTGTILGEYMLPPIAFLVPHGRLGDHAQEPQR